MQTKQSWKKVCAGMMSAVLLTTAWLQVSSVQSTLLTTTETGAAYSMSVSAADSYDWSGYLKKSADWYGGADAIALANEIVKYQLADGGWRKAMADTSQSGSWAKSTTDNDATTSQITILARVYNKTGNNTFRDACLKAIDLLINGQYANGGWPQVFNDAGTYHAHITFNDGAMVRVLNIMKSVSERSGDFAFLDDNRAAKAATAVKKGTDCILKMQIVVNGVKTAWCQQHDESSLAPAPARAYELPSISASESVGVVNFLKSVAGTDNAILESINAAVTWMTKSQINGISVVSTGDDKIVVADANAAPIWARFYDIQTNQPMFVDRDGSIHSTLAELSQERRTGYAWYGNWPKALVAAGTLPIVPETPVVLNGKWVQALTVADAANAADWSIQSELRKGNAIYGDRDATFTDLPDALGVAEWVRTACDSKTYADSLATFTAGAALSVFVLLDTRVSPVPAWLADWSNTGKTASASNDVTYTILQKDVPSGTKVTLGSNGTSTSVVNYAVAVAEQGTVLLNPPTANMLGDVNCDNTVDVGDVILLSRYVAEDQLASVTEQGILNAECDGDATITSGDVRVILQYIAHIIKEIQP